jgi:hypothetical protein
LHGSTRLGARLTLADRALLLPRPKTPYFGACPIDFKAVTPGLAAPHKKIVETHASQARAILSNLRNTIAEDTDEKAARERQRCASIIKTIKKVKAERVKNQAYEEKKHADCLAWLTAQEKEIAQLAEQLEKEKARHAAWQATQKQHAEKCRKEAVTAKDKWLSALN